VIWPAITATGPIAEVFKEHVPQWVHVLQYTLLVGPLCLLWLLHCYWYQLLLKKAARKLGLLGRAGAGGDGKAKRKGD
jgi:hypothetical protein